MMNGPGSEPPPRNRFGIATAFMPSRRRSLAAPGKPSIPRFKVYYLPQRRVRFKPRPLDFLEGDLPNATAYGGTEDIYNSLWNPRIGAVCLASAKTDSFHIVLLSQQFRP